MEGETQTETVGPGESLDAGIIRDAERLAAEHQNPPRRGPGRPRVHAPGMEPAADAAGDGLPGGDSPRVGLPPDVAAKLAKTLWAAVDEIAKGALKTKAAALPKELAGGISELVDSAGFSEAQIDSLAELTPLVVEEWGLNAAYSPTVALALVAGTGAVSFLNASRQIASLADEYRRKTEPAAA